MQTYKNYAPTSFDSKGLALDDQQDWFVVPVGQNRDSGCLARSNFEVAVKLLGGESETVEVHRFGHWANGWFEIIIVHPSLEGQVLDIEGTLESYPILDDEHYNNLEYETACTYWEHASTKERIYWCNRFRVSIFAARRDEIPEDCTGELLFALAE